MGVQEISERPRGTSVAWSHRGPNHGRTSAASGETTLINEFLEEVYSLTVLGDLQGATDKIFETVDRLLLEGAFTVCNEILRCVEVRRLPTALWRSFLTITVAAKDKLPARKAFYHQVLSEMIRLKGNEKAQRLLGQLA